jgi:hypothetical protein
VFCLCSGPPKIVTMLVRSDQPDDDFGVSFTSVSLNFNQPLPWWCHPNCCFCCPCLHC